HKVYHRRWTGDSLPVTGAVQDNPPASGLLTSLRATRRIRLSGRLRVDCASSAAFHGNWSGNHRFGQPNRGPVGTAFTSGVDRRDERAGKRRISLPLGAETSGVGPLHHEADRRPVASPYESLQLL